MKKLSLCLFLGLASYCFALEDSPANRATEATRYMNATPVSEMMNDMAQNISKNMPEEQRAAFIQTMTKNLDLTAIGEATKKSLVKTFTADELKALADFYSSKDGKAANKKMGTYMAEIMPVMQTEVQKAMQKTQAGQ